MRKIGIDIGKKRIGVAISDPTGRIAQPLLVLERRRDGAEVEAIRTIIREHQVDEVIVGLPIMMSGTSGQQVQTVKHDIRRLEEAIDVPVKEWDERLTTSLAEKALISADVRREKRKKIVDKLAASLILQNYLDYLRAEDLKKNEESR